MSNSTAIANNLFDAVDIIVDKKLQSLPYNRTLVGEVLSKTEDGGYRVQSAEITFVAYPADRNMKYLDNTRVVVSVPNNSMNGTKIILGAVGAQMASLQDTTGDLSALTTQNKDNLVMAINEINATLAMDLSALDALIGAGE